MKYNLLIRGEIGNWWSGTSADDIIQFLNRHQDEHLDIAICSPGGYVEDGLEIYQALKDHGNVTAHIIGLTASIATVIAMGAKTVDMVKGSLILIHNASTAVVAWQTANKQELDQIISKWQTQRNNLDTMDKVIAYIYGMKNGKSLEENLNKMDKAEWITADDALEFGLIDEIREDDGSDDDIINKVQNLVSTKIKDYGLPALPKTTITKPERALANMVDEKGDPTESFAKKTFRKIQNLINGEINANKKTIDMKESYKQVAGILAIDALESKDGKITLSEDQMKKIEDHLVDLDKKVKDAETDKATAVSELTKTKDDLTKAQNELTEKKSEVDNLKKSPGAETCEHVGENNIEKIDSYNLYKQINQ